MTNGLENRLRKLEKTVRAQEDEIDQGARREQFREMRSTPEGRKLLKKLAKESCERILSAMQARERAQIAKMVPPEQLERFKKQWTAEDAKREALRAENARVDAWIESIGGHDAWIAKYCTPGVQRNKRDDEDEEGEKYGSDLIP